MVVVVLVEMVEVQVGLEDLTTWQEILNSMEAEAVEVAKPLQSYVY